MKANILLTGEQAKQLRKDLSFVVKGKHPFAELCVSEKRIKVYGLNEEPDGYR